MDRDVAWYVDANGQICDEENAVAQVEGVAMVEYERATDCAEIAAIDAYLIGGMYSKAPRKAPVTGRRFARLVDWLEMNKKINTLQMARTLRAETMSHDREVSADLRRET